MGETYDCPTGAQIRVILAAVIWRVHPTAPM